MATGYPVKANYATGDVLTAANMNDLSNTVNLAVGTTPSTATQMAGKNAILNSDYSIWQRGTSFSNPASGAYTADRWICYYDGTGASRTISQQAFTAGTAPVAGYEAQYFTRYALTAAGSSATYFVYGQRIEDVRTYAGQTVTLSFWAKAATSTALSGLALAQNFGSGGSAQVTTYAASAPTLTTSWVRYTATIAIPSVSGKTIGTSSYLELQFNMPVTGTPTIDIWGVQLEAGSTATPFQTATGTKQGELAACQRYLPAFSGQGNSFMGLAISTSVSKIYFKLPTTARVQPTGITVSTLSNFSTYSKSYSGGTPTAIAFDTCGTDSGYLSVTTTAGSPTLAAGEIASLQFGNASASILFTGCEL